jgi:hypothetical protein
MPKRQKETTSDERLERLIEAVERVREELGYLYQILDQISDDFGLALSKGRLPTIPESAILTCFPVDPLAPDWNDRVNSITPRERAQMAAAIAAEHRHTASQQRELW